MTLSSPVKCFNLFSACVFPLLPGVQASPAESGSSAGDGTHIFCQRNRDNKPNSGYHELIRSITDCSSNSWRYLCMVSLKLSDEVSSLFRHSRSLTYCSFGRTLKHGDSFPIVNWFTQSQLTCLQGLALH